MGCIVLLAVQWGVVLFAGLAAILWWLSALVRLPAHINIVVFEPIGISPDAQTLVAALTQQSRLSQWAAVCAGIAAALQAVVTAFHD